MHFVGTLAIVHLKLLQETNGLDPFITILTIYSMEVLRKLLVSSQFAIFACSQLNP
jgi:hypothetical protein